MFIRQDICFECESTEGLEQHHIVPRSYGGKKTIPLCYRCHSKAHGNNKMRRNSNHALLIKRGLEKAKTNGKKIGRPKGSKSDDYFLKKHPEIVKCLKKGISIRKIAVITNSSSTTVQKIKNMLNLK